MTNLAVSRFPPEAIPAFNESLHKAGWSPLRRAPLTELQVNVGRLCNQACNHCHVDAGPKRTEIMTWETMTRILHWRRESGLTKVDITGGAPELNPHFRQFVESLINEGVQVTCRCNLTILLETGQRDLARWYANRGIRLVCSLPCYNQDNVDAQRGRGVFLKSIEALKLLNKEGYGKQESLTLDLVYNPNGAFLPPEQSKLELDYKKNLFEQHGIEFTRLLTLSNLPISRFQHYLERTGKEREYWNLLYEKFNPGTLEGLMCRHLISVDWQGKVYDCDFNQMLELPLASSDHTYLWQINSQNLTNNPIAVGSHCYGCTAGAGSSCGGALTDL